MSQSQWQVVAVVYAVVLIGSVVLLRWAFARRRQFRRRYRHGLGAPNAPQVRDPWRRFTNALAAPYARFELSRRHRSKVDRDRLYFGYVDAGNGAGVPFLVGALRRDWRVSDPATARERVGEFSEVATAYLASIADLWTSPEDPDPLRARLVRAGVPEAVIASVLEQVQPASPEQLVRPPDRTALAFDLGRSANLIRWCAVIGYLDAEEIAQPLDLAGALAVIAFESWEEYGERYVAGLRQARAPQQRDFAKAVTWLTTDAASPWRSLPWGGSQ